MVKVFLKLSQFSKFEAIVGLRVKEWGRIRVQLILWWMAGVNYLGNCFAADLTVRMCSN